MPGKIYNSSLINIARQPKKKDNTQRKIFFFSKYLINIKAEDKAKIQQTIKTLIVNHETKVVKIFEKVIKKENIKISFFSNFKNNKKLFKMYNSKKINKIKKSLK